MRRGSKIPLTTLQSHISAAFWRDAAKQIESGLVRAGVECTPRQAKRIAETGAVPGRFRAALLRLLDDAISRNKSELERLHAQLKALDYEDMVGRAEDRRTAASREAADRPSAVAWKVSRMAPPQDRG